MTISVTNSKYKNTGTLVLLDLQLLPPILNINKLLIGKIRYFVTNYK
jgi:hypothetical protein